MQSLTADAIRASFLNVSQRERTAIPLPDLDTVAWEKVDFLGWRDRKQPLLGYVVADLDGEPAGVLLRQAEPPRARAQCSWCEDVQLPAPVVFFSAKRSGDAGRRGDTVGTLVCAGFECSAHVRKLPTMAYLGFDREAERERRIGVLRERVGDFLTNLRV
ncbi:FBP domain-containing protein [Pseudolysinimonas sp.]|jgi:hypothetical protein|uniref:FBP domain-containing protein n=1 Tax=Pseudolysinimonas sp. TaxID=2680009 RepID=UPI0037851531